MKVRSLATAAALAGALAVSTTAAQAAVVFDFGVGPNGVATSSWAGNQGQTHTYTASGLSIVASAFGPSRYGHADQLYGKHNGGDENGLGMTNDPTGDHEIEYGKGFIQLDVSALYGKVVPGSLDLSFGSTTGGETWKVYGSNDAGVVGSALLPSSKTLIGSGATESALLDLVGGYKYYDVESVYPKYGSSGGNVLIKSLAVTAVPEPAAWGLMIAGVFGVGAMMRRQRRQAFATA